MNQDSIDHFNQHLSLLPEALQPDAKAIFDDLSDHLPNATRTGPDWLSSLPQILISSPFIANLLRNNSTYLAELIENGHLFKALDTDCLFNSLTDALTSTDNEPKLLHYLRHHRNLALLQIAYRDLCGWADLEEVMLSLSKTAEVILSATQRCSNELCIKRFGTPIGDHSNNEQKLIVIAMGKLGGGELNFSSDVDLIFCYPENGLTTSDKKISNQEFFIRQTKLFIKLLTTQTADGFVYRVDTRLRPNGDSGPLCLSFSAMDSYYQLHGRDWERYAFIKANIIAGDKEKGVQLLSDLQPFIYRKYLDFSAIESLREMKEKIDRSFISKQSAIINIKLNPGGIREVEFIAQAHQLIRGGRNPALQNQSLLIVLDELHLSEFISIDEYNTLVDGYTFLRKCENRLQIYADLQTHTLPQQDKQQQILALTMGCANWVVFYRKLSYHMTAIHKIFRTLFMTTAGSDNNTDFSPAEMDLKYLWNNELDDKTANEILSQNHYKQTENLHHRLSQFHNSSQIQSLSSSAAARLDRLVPVLLYEVGQIIHSYEDSDLTILRCLDLLSVIVKRSVYLSLLLDNEAARQQLIRLIAASPFVSILIQRNPILLDDLLSGYSANDFTRDKLSKKLTKQLFTAPQHDLDQQMNLLREFNHSNILAVASLGISNNFSASETGHALSALAEVCTQESLRLSIRGIEQKHGYLDTTRQQRLSNIENTPFCIIAYGKLGSHELGYGSDLDLVFMSSSEDASLMSDGPRRISAGKYFARIGQRLVHIMSTRTPAGRLYEMDMRLRPSGNSGPLVTSITRLQRYMTEKAWVWEHQALVRARALSGNAELKQQFIALRHEVLCRNRDEDQLKIEIISMRDHVRRSKKRVSNDIFDLKQGYGGIVDIEFMVQYMVLRWAHDYPQLTGHTETRELLDELGRLELLGVETQQILQQAFAFWLEKSYQLKLNELPAILPSATAEVLATKVVKIWNTLLSSNQN